MKCYAIYNTTSGKITSTYLVEDDYLQSSIELNESAGEDTMECTDLNTLPTTHYIDLSGTPVETVRQSLDTICSLTNSGGVWTANGTDTISYGSALPNPSSYFIQCAEPGLNGATGVVTDGTLTLTTNKPGAYTITIDSFPYLTKVITITAV